MTSDFFDILSETITKTAKEFTERTESVYEYQKIKGKIYEEEKKISKAKTLLGELAYKKYLTSGIVEDEEMEKLCQKIRKHYEILESYKEDGAKLRNEKCCSSCGKSIAKDAVFCSYCGARCENKEESSDEECVSYEEFCESESEEETTGFDVEEEKE